MERCKYNYKVRETTLCKKKLSKATIEFMAKDKIDETIVQEAFISLQKTDLKNANSDNAAKLTDAT